MPKLDDMNWHLNGGEFPAGLAEDNAATHIGFFVAWAINKGLWAAPQNTDEEAAIQRVRDRTSTGRTFLIEHCDGKLFSAMFNQEGSTFAKKYYSRLYDQDYRRVVIGELENDYLVADSWDNFERMAEVIDLRYAQDIDKPWWRFWSR